MRTDRRNIFASTLVLVLLGFSLSAGAFFSIDDTKVGVEIPFSEAFRNDYQAAEPDSNSKDVVPRLESMLLKYGEPQEQAELHLTLGVIRNQRTGLTDHSSSVEHMTAALKYELPPAVLVKVCLWRGSSFETLNKKDDALNDYLRGLLLCVRYDLPNVMADPPGVDMYDYSGPTNSPAYRAIIAEHTRQIEYRNKVMFERHMLMYRGCLINGAKRILGTLGLSPDATKKIVNSISKDETKSGKILLLIQSHWNRRRSLFIWSSIMTGARQPTD